MSHRLNSMTSEHNNHYSYEIKTLFINMEWQEIVLIIILKHQKNFSNLSSDKVLQYAELEKCNKLISTFSSKC